VSGLTLVLTVPASAPSHIVEDVLSEVYRVAKTTKVKYKIKVDVEVKEVADSFPSPSTFHNFHRHELHEEEACCRVFLSYHSEESADGFEEIAREVASQLKEIPFVAGAGMSWVGVAEAA